MTWTISFSPFSIFTPGSELSARKEAQKERLNELCHDDDVAARMFSHREKIDELEKSRMARGEKQRKYQRTFISDAIIHTEELRCWFYQSAAIRCARINECLNFSIQHIFGAYSFFTMNNFSRAHKNSLSTLCIEKRWKYCVGHANNFMQPHCLIAHQRCIYKVRKSLDCQPFAVNHCGRGPSFTFIIFIPIPIPSKASIHYALRLFREKKLLNEVASGTSCRKKVI